jgi:surface polysaccharide O-acyltransferase-like enzyme
MYHESSTAPALEIEKRNIRISGIDAGRFIAVAAVVLIHTAHDITYTILTHQPQEPHEGEFGINGGDIITQLVRFAVPFFFLTSGFFFARRLEDPIFPTIKMLARRLILPFLSFSIAYNLISPLRFAWFTKPVYITRWILNGGAGHHLWFLPALFLWLSLALLMKRVMGWTALLMCGLLFYAVGLLLGAYQSLLFSHPHAALSHLGRDGPFFGFVFIVIGMWIQAKDVSLNMGQAVSLFCFGACAELLEAYVLNAHHIISFFKPDFLVATLPFGVGAFVLTLSVNAQNGTLGWLASLGRYSFGIYAAHLFFVQCISYLVNPGNLLQRLLVAAMSLGCTTLVILTIGRNRFLRTAFT